MHAIKRAEVKHGNKKIGEFWFLVTVVLGSPFSFLQRAGAAEEVESLMLGGHQAGEG